MDRAEAIKWFEEKIKDLAEPTYPADINSASGLCQWLDMTDRFMSAYRLAIAALREQEQSKWISVEERLPEANRLVLCWWQSGDGEREHYGFARYQSHGVWYVSNEGMPNVTHWMPLPEPPKEGADHAD